MIKNKTTSILFIGEHSIWSEIACNFVKLYFDKVSFLTWSKKDKRPDIKKDWSGDWIISFKSDLVLAKEEIELAKKGAINFHPSTPKYRGIGGYFHAINNRDAQFGATCHIMDKHIDHGLILKTVIFDIKKSDTEKSLRERTAIYCLALLHDVIQNIFEGNKLKPNGEIWGKRLYLESEIPKSNIKTR